MRITLSQFPWDPAKGQTIRKVMGGVGEFLSCRNFFPYQIPSKNFF